MRFSLLPVLFLTSTAFAQMDSGSGSYGSPLGGSSSSSRSGSGMTGSSASHNFMILGGMSRGGFALGAAYEYLWDNSTGIGAHIRTFPKKVDTTTGAHGFMIFGAGLGHHFFKKKWDLAFTPSFNMISIDSYVAALQDVTTFGPGMSVALMWQLTEKIWAGFDHSTYWAWFDDKWAGLVMSDFALKVKASF